MKLMNTLGIPGMLIKWPVGRAGADEGTLPCLLRQQKYDIELGGGGVYVCPRLPPSHLLQGGGGHGRQPEGQAVVGRGLGCPGLPLGMAHALHGGGRRRRHHLPPPVAMVVGSPFHSSSSSPITTTAAAT